MRMPQRIPPPFTLIDLSSLSPADHGEHLANEKDEWWKLKLPFLVAFSRVEDPLLQGPPMVVDMYTLFSERDDFGERSSKRRKISRAIADMGKIAVEAYTAVPVDRIVAMLEEGLKPGANQTSAGDGIAAVTHADLPKLVPNMVYSENCPTRPGYLQAAFLEVYANPTLSRHTEGPGRIYDRGAVIAQSIIVHFIHPLRLTQVSGRGNYRVDNRVLQRHGINPATGSAAM